MEIAHVFHLILCLLRHLLQIFEVKYRGSLCELSRIAHVAHSKLAAAAEENVVVHLPVPWLEDVENVLRVW